MHFDDNRSWDRYPKFSSQSSFWRALGLLGKTLVKPELGPGWMVMYVYSILEYRAVRTFLLILHAICPISVF